MRTMLCFDPCDTIFVLNKWDALIFQKHKPEEVVFAEKKGRYTQTVERSER